MGDRGGSERKPSEVCDTAEELQTECLVYGWRSANINGKHRDRRLVVICKSVSKRVYDGVE